jgi:hypothetical protein
MALDFYTVTDGHGRLQALVVEEFVLRDDFTAAALDTAGFSGVWWSSAEFSRRLRTDAAAVTAPVSRVGAEAAFGDLGGDELPSEAVLRDRFGDRVFFPDGPPLRLGPDDGSRLYRLLFARDLDERHLAGLLAALRLSPVSSVDHPRVAGRTATEHGTCELRRVGDLAWSIDLVFASASEVIGPTVEVALHAARGHGLIPVTIERFR